MAYITKTNADNLVHVANVLYNYGLHGLGKVSSSAYVKGINEPTTLPGDGLFCAYVRTWVQSTAKVRQIVEEAGYTVRNAEERFGTTYVTFDVTVIPGTVQA